MQRISVQPADVEAIERATVETVSPEATEEFDGWLIAFDRGTIGRAKCTVPLRHAPVDPVIKHEVETRYAARGFSPMFRLPGDPGFNALKDTLRADGYVPGRDSLVQVANITDVRNLVADPNVQIAAKPDAAWGEVFLGEGFDPVDGASRVKALSRAPDAVYASIRERAPDGTESVIAAGAASFGHGWSSIHTMRTALARRREGLAGRILAALAQVACERGYEKMFLQVEENNAAQSLYRRAGFDTAWRYAYWER